MRPVLAVLALGALGACTTTAPPRVDVQTPSAWQAAPALANAPRDAYWQDMTQDGVLQGLLNDAGAVADVDVARARLAEAQSLAQAARASLFPTLGATASAQAAAPERGVGVATTSGSVGLVAPLDLFGANQARAGSAAARADAAEAELAAARVAARRTVGQLYAALRTAQSSRASAQRQTRDAEDSLNLARARASAGLENGLAVAQAQAAADAARARIPVFAQAESQARLGLEAVLGLAPGALSAQLTPSSTPALSPAFTPDRLLDAPAAVLARRPDVRAAQARLAAAGLDARAALADRWPNLSLNAALTSTSASRGVDGGVATGGLSLAATLFDFGRLQALAQAAGARADAEAALYRRTVMFALSDVEREADRLLRAREEADAARAAVTSSRDQTELARIRYTSGLSSFIDVLLAQRAFADAEIALAGAEGRVTDAGVSLAAALGLGQDAP